MTDYRSRHTGGQPMPPRAKGGRKRKRSGMACDKCGEQMKVAFTRPLGRAGVSRVRRCRGCGWECRTVEVVKGQPPPAA